MSNNQILFNLKIKDEATSAVKSLQASFSRASDAAEVLFSNLTKTESSLSVLGNKAFHVNQIKEVILNVSSAFKEIARPAADFEESMRAVNTMAAKSEEEFGKMKRAVSSLSREIPIARDLLAKGLYQTISNGVPEDNWIEFLNRSSKASVGALADLEKVVTVTSTVIKNYGLDWEDAGVIQDKMQKTTQNGVTSFEQLADALPRVSGSAATLDVSIDELLATFATLTGVSGNTAEVSTQLSAVFTALIKPSAEAAKIAKEMGVNFNAAAIKMAGGLLPFLQQMEEDIEAYARSTGMLKEEIYGTLYGSAQALRALTPLTGQLSEKFSENVSAMTDSVGTIDEAFEQMNSTSKASIQRLKNIAAGFTDFTEKIAGGLLPFMTFISYSGIAYTQLSALGATIKGVNIKAFINGIIRSNAVLKMQAIATKTATSVTLVYRLAIRKLTIALHSAKAAAVTLKAVLTAGVSLAIWGLVEGISYLLGKKKDLEKATQEAVDAEEDYKKIMVESRAEIVRVAAEIKAFSGSKEEEKKKILELNSKYGEAFGYYKTMSEWYDTLTKKSELYAKMMVNEARMRVLANKAADARVKADEFKKKREAAWKEQKARDADLPEGERKLSVITEDPLTYAAEREAAILEEQLGSLAAENAKLVAKMMSDTKKTLDTNPVASPVNVNKKGVKDLPKEIKSLEDVNRLIEHQEELYLKADDASRSAVGKELERLKGIKSQMSDMYDSEAGIKSYEDLDRALEHYEHKLKSASAEERKALYDKIEALRALKEVWDDSLKSPSSVDRLNTLKDLSSAISFYEAQQQKQSLEEAMGTETVIIALKKKKTEMERLLKLPALREESVQFEGFGDAELLLHIKEIGLDGVKERLKELKGIAEDGVSPLSQKDQDILHAMISQYEGYEKKLTKTASTSEAFSSVTAGLSGTMRALSGVVGEAASGWLQYGANIITAIQQAIPQIVAFIAVQKGQANANAEAATAGAAAAVAGIPIVGPIMAVAAIGSIIAALASIPKFAQGGLAFGPTLGVFGEYPGASNNPEVVAPLSTLKQYLVPQQSVGEVVFKIGHRELIGVLKKSERLNSRTK